VSGVSFAFAVAPALGVASGCGAEVLVRRARPAVGRGRLVLLVAAAVLVVGVTAWRIAGAGGWWQTAVLVLAVVAVPISAMDLSEQRIPDAVLAPASTLGALLLGLDAAASHRGGTLVRAVLAAAVLYAGALVLLLAARDSLGYGDVKALSYQGIYTGYLGWGLVLGALLLTFATAAVAALALAVRRRGGRSRRVAFAPYVLGSMLAAVLIR
jgi:leader peptidase (prepilin peptidase) / N-methyltransferase